VADFPLWAPGPAAGAVVPHIWMAVAATAVGRGRDEGRVPSIRCPERSRSRSTYDWRPAVRIREPGSATPCWSPSSPMTVNLLVGLSASSSRAKQRVRLHERGGLPQLAGRYDQGPGTGRLKGRGLRRYLFYLPACPFSFSGFQHPHLCYPICYPKEKWGQLNQLTP